MRFIRRIFQVTTIVILAAGIPYLAYLLYESLDRPAKDPVQAIPDRTALIIHINNPLGLLEELTRNSLIWKEFLGYPGVKPIQEQLMLIDSMSRWSPDIRDILKDSPLTVALSLHNRSKFDPLFLMPVPSSLDGSSLASFFTENYPGKITILQSPYGQTEIYRIHFENRKNPLFASVWEGVCIFSFTDDLVKRALDQLSLNTPVSVMKGFSTVASTTGKKVDANIYVNFPYLSLALWKGVNETHNKGLVKFARYADWSGLDLYLKKDELLLNGYTIASDSAMQTLALLNDQVPLPLTVTRILPGNTQAYLIYALMNYPDYFRRWQFRLQRASFSTEGIDLFDDLNEKYDTMFLPSLESWVGRQIARCWTDRSPGADALSVVTIVQSANPDTARKSLLSLSRKIAKNTDSTDWEGIPIYRTNLSEVLNIWLSPLFEPSDLSFFTVIGEFVCFSENQKTLKDFLSHHTRGEWLSENSGFQVISDNIPDQSNISFYSASKHILDALPEVLNLEYMPFFIPVIDSLKKFQAFSLQLSNEDGMFLTSIQLHFNPNRTEEGPLAWQVSLDTLVAGKPQILHAGICDTLAVLVTDTVNTLYMIGRNGQIVWKKKLYGRVLGSFHEVRLKDKDSLFYLFNTENHLYLMRSDGILASRFPMKFPVKATNGLSIAAPGRRISLSSSTGRNDLAVYPLYSASKENFQVVIAFSNNRIYSFDLNGLLTEGWTSPEVNEAIRIPIQVLGQNTKPVLIATMKSGELVITDGIGEKKGGPMKRFANSPNSVCYVNLTNTKAPWLTTDLQGKVTYFGQNGQVSQVNFNTFSENHYFLYDDILGNGSPEFIFFDNNTLYYYDRFFRLIYFYGFRHDVSSPNLMKMANGKSYIGFTSNTTNEIFLFDRNGYVEIESGVKGTTPFDVGFMEDENYLNLVIGSGKNVKNFRLKPIP
ncbi:MAG: hypothetical protein IH596_09535 [Bacteroidales bacterium]|nr:hypothetical protein [Bacteroidales bacterium]